MGSALSEGDVLTEDAASGAEVATALAFQVGDLAGG